VATGYPEMLSGFGCIYFYAVDWLLFIFISLECMKLNLHGLSIEQIRRLIIDDKTYKHHHLTILLW